MADHYYTKRPSTGHDRQYIEETHREKTLKFATDAGVFSKKGIDFGSKLLIEHMQFSKSANVLDVGCGYGPIGLYAAKLIDQGSVTMIDINERAVQLAQENAKVNQIHNVSILQSDLYENIDGKLYTTILTNPPIRAGKKVVHDIYEGAPQHLVDGGQLWVVIQKKQGAPSTYAKLQELFDSVDEIYKDKGYKIYKATKV